MQPQNQITAPVREVIRDGENGERGDFFDPVALSRKILAALNDPGWGQALRVAAQASAQAYRLDAGLQGYELLLDLPPAAPDRAQQAAWKVASV
ncbi:hypothetical protein Q9Q94_08640 [Uliginosibacterium sp. 31-16]|uniref:hypothetical protein n=1 Tax=Uliginosibacterium sp. 31-16 TaxID=3068315 RepID=UPI00274024FD|nr:hypothetical protein [Uliginosibacterium sp. 31-16]MDP5239595.1 hypothetical protein [Uliginosibacterium sp. 31-16]